MLPVSLYAPKASATVWTWRGDRYDLDADLLSLSTDRSVGNSTGKWSASLTGRRIGRGTYADAIQPMDYIEIRMARVPSQDGLALVMRGFVDNVTRIRDAAGRVRVQINGRDFGKILLQAQVYYLTEIDPVSSIIPQARLELDYGIPAGLLSATQFVALVFDRIVQPSLDLIRANNSAIPSFAPAVEVPDLFAVNGFTIQPFTGSVITLLNQYATKPWIEVFPVDTDAGPILRYRFAPLRTRAGSAVAGYSAAPPEHTITPSDMMSENLSASDNEVYSYYFTYPVYSYLDRTAFKGEGISLNINPFLDTDALNRYGYRPLEIATALIPSLVGDPASTGPTPEPLSISVAAELNQWLVRAYTDNAAFRSGAITVQGGGGMQPGEYVRTNDMSFYIQGVQHQFSIEAGSYQTTLTVVRGSG